jgi:hypothetical protein
VASIAYPVVFPTPLLIEKKESRALVGVGCSRGSSAHQWAEAYGEGVSSSVFSKAKGEQPTKIHFSYQMRE